MSDRFNNKGEITDSRTIDRIDHIKSNAKQHFLCLIDSGASPVEIKAVAQKVCEAIGAASDEAIADYLQQLEEIKEREGEGQI